MYSQRKSEWWMQIPRWNSYAMLFFLLAFVFPVGLGPLMSYISFYICNRLYSPTWAEWFKDLSKYSLSKFCSSRRWKGVREQMTKQCLVNVWFPEGNLFRVVRVGFVRVLFLEAWLWEQIRCNCQMILVSLLLQSVVLILFPSAMKLWGAMWADKPAHQTALINNNALHF